MASPTSRTAASNLPADSTSFVGRRRESAEVRRLLSSGRLVTLVGAGGVGKTRLALRAAGELRHSYADGVWLVELAPVRTGERVAHAVADAVGLRGLPGVPLEESLAQHLAERSTLLLLDNCEHLIPTTGALVHQLLRRCPDLRILATSREPFGLVGEYVVTVPTLTFPDRASADDPELLVRFDSVNLFVERAAAGSPGFELTAHNSAQVLSICADLEGIPLAIELAAVRVRTLPLDTIVARLKDHRPRPGRGTHAHPTHHRTLRASVEWSHELCTSDERRLWARLSAFSGGFDLAAVHAVCTEPDEPAGHVTDAVAALVDKSIVMHERTPSGPRYRMLEILREFGEEQLAEEPQEQTRITVRHRDWFVALAEDSARSWLDADQPAVLARLREDYGNLRVAFTRALADPDGVSHALTIASALEYYWMIRGWQSEGRQWLDDALAVAPPDSPARARALRVNAYLATLQGDPVPAAAMAAEARTAARRAGDRVELDFVSMVDGVIALCTGDCGDARVHLETALGGFQSAGHARGEANSLIVLVSIAAATEDPALAELCHRRCMTLTEPGREAYIRGFSLWGRGIAALRAGEHEEALGLERESLRLKRSLDDQLGLVLCIEALAWVDVARGADERAAVLLGGSQRLWSPMRISMGSIVDFGRFRAEYDDLLLRRLGRRRLDAALRRGSRMTVDQLLDLALGDEDRPPATTSPLTARELEVAPLVAQGMTNKRIALALSLSQRTVEGHVEKIMTKLGLSSRTQIAAWVAEKRAELGAEQPVPAPAR